MRVMPEVTSKRHIYYMKQILESRIW